MGSAVLQDFQWLSLQVLFFNHACSQHEELCFENLDAGFVAQMRYQLIWKNLSPVVNAALAEKASQMPAPAPDTKLGVTLFQHKHFILRRAGGVSFPIPQASCGVGWCVGKSILSFLDPFQPPSLPILHCGERCCLLHKTASLCPILVSAVGCVSLPLIMFPATPCCLSLLPQFCKWHKNLLAYC